MMTKEIFKKIVPSFCQDIIAAIANLDLPQKQYNKQILDSLEIKLINNFDTIYNDLFKEDN